MGESVCLRSMACCCGCSRVVWWLGRSFVRSFVSSHRPTHRYILEILVRAGLAQGRNVLVQGSLRDSTWHADYFQELRRLYPGLRIAIIHVRPAGRQAGRQGSPRGGREGF